MYFIMRLRKPHRQEPQHQAVKSDKMQVHLQNNSVKESTSLKMKD